MEEQEVPIIKIVVVGILTNSLGESGVGKSNIISRYAYDKFYIGLNPTIGLQLISKKIRLDDEEICLQIWDTAGQQRFRSLNGTFYRNSMGGLIVFNLGDRGSFMNVKRWRDELREQTRENLVMILVGNKCDLKEREVSVDEASRFAQEEGMAYIETSAALNIGIDKMFEMLSRKILEVFWKQVKKKENRVFSILSKVEDDDRKRRRRRCCE